MPRRAGRRAPDPRRPHRRARHGYALASGQAARWHSAVALDSSSEQIRPHDGGPAMPCEPLPRPLGTTALVIGGRAGQPVDGGLRPARRLVARQALEGQRTPRDGVNRSGGSPPADSRPDDCRTDRTVEPAPTRATSDEPSHPGAILTPTRDENPDDHPDDHGRERSGLGAKTWPVRAVNDPVRTRRLNHVRAHSRHATRPVTVLWRSGDEDG